MSPISIPLHARSLLRGPSDARRRGALLLQLFCPTVAAAHNNDLFALAQLSFKKRGAVMDPVPHEAGEMTISGEQYWLTWPQSQGKEAPLR
jgi:hypothetical protein